MNYKSCALGIVGSLFVGGMAQGAYLYNWSATPTVAEAEEWDVKDGRDIVGFWWAVDATYYYFRMDLAAQPHPTNTSVSYSSNYGVYIDTDMNDATGGNGLVGGDSGYLPDFLKGIDVVLDSHYGPTVSTTGTWERFDLHKWTGSAYEGHDNLPAGYHQETENGGKTLEWKVAKTDVGSGLMRVWAATHLVAPQDDDRVYDSVGPAGGILVPEPAMLGLFGAVGLLSLRRRRD